MNTGPHQEHTQRIVLFALLLYATAQAWSAAEFQLQADYVLVAENGTHSIEIRLSEQPAADVTGVIAFVSGDSDITVSTGSPFTILRNAWQTPVMVVFAAANDADTVSGMAFFALRETSGNGIPEKTLTLRELEDDGLIQVGGTISVNTTWDVTSQEYLITSTVTIPAGVTLTIGPGVSVRQQANTFHGFHVLGRLVVTQSALLLRTRAHSWHWPSVVQGIIVGDGGSAELTATQIFALEDSSASGEGNPQLPAAVYAGANATVSLSFCSLLSLNANSGGYRTGYGVRIEGATASIADLPAQTRITGFRNGTRVVVANVPQTIGKIAFTGCATNVEVQGTLSRSMAFPNAGQKMTGALTVAAGGAMSLPAGSSLETNGQRLTVSNGASAAVANATVTIDLHPMIQGNLTMTDSTVNMTTRAHWDANTRRHGLWVTDGGSVQLTRCTVRTVETDRDYWNDGNRGYWSAAVYVTNTGGLTVQDSTFTCNHSGTGYRTGYALRIESATTTVADLPAPSRISGFGSGVRLAVANVPQSVGRIVFTDCLQNMHVLGTLASNMTFPNSGQYLVGSLTVAAGGAMSLPSGSWLLTNGQRLTVSTGASMTVANATMTVDLHPIIQGSLTMTDSTMNVTTRAYWDPNDRRHGLWVTNGGIAQLTRCTLRADETNRDYWDSNPGDWAAVLYATNTGTLTVQGCTFLSANSNGYRTGYGIRIADATATVGFAPSLAAAAADTDALAVATRFTGFQAGIGQTVGSSTQTINTCEFTDCRWNVRLDGNPTKNQELKNTGIHVVANTTVPAGVTLTLISGSELIVREDVWLVVKGSFVGTDATLRLNTKASWNVNDRKHGMIFREGGQGQFQRCEIVSTEYSDYSRDDNNIDYWVGSLYAEAGSKVTVKGCRFTSTNTVSSYRTGYGVQAEGGTADIGDDVTAMTAAVIRTSFTGYRTGIRLVLGTEMPQVAVCDFTNCQTNVRVRGDVLSNLTLRNASQVMIGGLTVKSGATLTLPQGSTLNTNSYALSIENGASVNVDRSNLTIWRAVQNAGTLSISRTPVFVSTYAHWNPADRWHGFVLNNGSNTTFSNASLYVMETRGNYGDSDYAALVLANEGASLVMTNCYVTSIPGSNQHKTRYAIQTFSPARLDLTGNVFADNYFALRLHAVPSPVQIKGNDFHGNTWAVYNSTTTTVQARDNWWGHPSGPTHYENPGGQGDRVSDYVDFGQIKLEPPRTSVTAIDPKVGQEANNLTGAAEQNAVELLGFRVTPVSSAVNGLGFRLFGKSGLEWNQFRNIRLVVDANGDGNIGAGESTTVGGSPVVSAFTTEVFITFTGSFTSASNSDTGYILLADMAGLTTGAAFQVEFLPTRFRSSPGLPTASTVTGARHAIGNWLILSDPPGGQQPDRLTMAPAQSNVALFGFRLSGGSSQVNKIEFPLSDVIGLSGSKFSLLGLYRDVNANGQYDAGDTAVGGAPTIQISGGSGKFTFTSAFSAAGVYVLVGNLIGLSQGDRLTIGLNPTDITASGAVQTIGSVAPATHVVDTAYLLSQSNNWAVPEGFGLQPTTPAFPMLGFSITPLGRTVNALQLNLSSIVGIAQQDVTNAKLYYDLDQDGRIDTTDPVLATGAVSITGGTGSITFSSSFSLQGELLVGADFAQLANGNEFTVEVTGDNVTLPAGYSITGSVPPVRYIVQNGTMDSRGKNMNWTLTYRSPGGRSVNGRFNNAGDRIILGYDTGSAWIYDAQLNVPLVMLKDHYDKVEYAGFSADDSAAITVSHDGAVYIWDLATGSLRSSMFSDLLVTGAVPSPDFKKLMVITEGKARLLDIENEQRLWPFEPGNAEVRAIAYSPNGQYVLIGTSDGRVWLLNAQTGAEVKRHLWHSRAINALAFIGDGSSFMSGSEDGTVNLVNLVGSPYRTISLDGQEAQGAAVTRDGRRIAMVTGRSSQAQLRVYNEDGLELYGINLSNESGGNWSGTLESLTFDNSGQRILVTGKSGGWATVAAFQTQGGHYIRSWGPQGAFPDWHSARPRISYDGETIFYLTDWGLNLLPRSTGRPITRSPNLTGTKGYAASEDGSRVAWFDYARNLHVDTVADTAASQFLVRDVGITYNTISMSPSGDRVAGGDRIFSTLTGSLRANHSRPDNEYPTAFSPDGTLWGFIDTGLRRIRTARTADRNATDYSTVDTDPFEGQQLLFHPDNRRVGIRVYNMGVQMYDMESWPEPEEAGRYRFPDGNNTDAAISKDGTMLLIGGANTVRLFEMKTMRVLRFFYPQHSSLQNVVVRSVQFAKDDTLIMIAWSDNYIETYERTRAVALEIKPNQRRLARGQTQAFQVEVVYDDTTRADVTPSSAVSSGTAVLELDPPTAGTVEGNLVTVSNTASGSFVVRALYRENRTTFTAEARITVGRSNLTALVPNPARLALNPGVFRRLRYTARYDDGYETEVTSGVELSTTRPDDIEISGQSVKVNLTAWPGDYVVTGIYTDEIGNSQTAETTITTFGQKTVWDRARITAGGYGLSGSFNPSKTQLATGWSSGGVAFYSVGVTPSQYKLKRILDAHDGPVIFQQYLTDQRMVTVSDDGTIKTWTLTPDRTGPDRVYHHDAPFTKAALSGNKLAFGDTSGKVGIYDVTTGATDWVVPVHSGAVNAVAIDSNTVLTGGADQRVKLLERTDGTVRRTLLPHSKPVVAVGFFGNNAFFTIGQDNLMLYVRKSDYTVVTDPVQFPSTPTAAEAIGGYLYVSLTQPVATWVFNTDGLLLRGLVHPPSRGSVCKHLIDPTGQHLLTGRRSVVETVENEFGWEEQKVSAFSSFQFWSTDRGIYRGSLAHSHPLIDAHAIGAGNRILTQSSKRTIQWNFDVPDASAESIDLLETGYFIAPSFSGMDFTADGRLMATRVDLSIYMFDTTTRLLWKTLNMPGGGGPFTISPNGTRMAFSNNRTRLWDLLSLTQIGEHPERTTALDFRKNDYFLGAVAGAKFIRIYDQTAVSISGMLTQYQPIQLFVNSIGDRCAAVTYETKGDLLSTTYLYYLEVFDISDPTDEGKPLFPTPLFLLSVTQDMFGGGDELPTFAIAVSDDTSLALVAASGNRPVKLIRVADQTTLREFYPAMGPSDQNLGAAAVDFADNDVAVLIGWAEGYAELFRRSNPVGLTVVPTEVQARSLARSRGSRLVLDVQNNRVVVPPGATIRLLTFARYENNEELNVTGSAQLSTQDTHLVTLNGSLLTVNDGVTRGDARILSEYEELGEQLTASLVVQIVGEPTPTPTPAGPWDLYLDGWMNSYDLFEFSRHWYETSDATGEIHYSAPHLLELIRELSDK